jgi:hypothetical protein
VASTVFGRTKRLVSAPFIASHRRAVEPQLPVTAKRPSGGKRRIAPRRRWPPRARVPRTASRLRPKSTPAKTRKTTSGHR